MSEKEFNTDDLGINRLGRRQRRTRPTEGGTADDTTQRNGDDNVIDLTSEIGKTVKQKKDESDGGESMSSNLHSPGGRKTGRHMRITMLGISGSGKTAFLSGVYQTMMVNGFHDLALTPSEDADDVFQQIGEIGNIALINQSNFDFPDGTLETTVFPLTLENGGESVCNFDFTDYAGGDISNILKADEEVTPGARALKRQLLKSDAILIFADAYVLCQGRNLAEWQQASGASKIAPLFPALVKAMGQDKAMTVIFVLTKTDDERIPAEMKANNFARLAERMVQTYNRIYQQVQKRIPDGWSFGVIPVSAVGEGNYQIIDGRTVARDGCAPEPYNIDAAMVYTIACILSQWKRSGDAEKEALTEKLIEEGRGNTLFGNLFSDLKKMPRPEKKVAGLLNEIEDKDKAINELSRHINDLVSRTGVREAVQQRRDHLKDIQGGW